MQVHQNETEPRWFVHTDGTNRGPFTLASIRTQIEFGVWSEEIPVWSQGESDWKKFSDVEKSVHSLEILEHVPATDPVVARVRRLPILAGLAIAIAFGAAVFASKIFTKPLPYLGDITVADQEILRSAIQAPRGGGAKLAFALAHGGESFLYLATNIAGERNFELKIEPIANTLAGHAPTGLRATVRTSDGLGRTPALTDGVRALPRGEYMLTSTCLDCSSRTENVFTQTTFLGGVRDEAYTRELAAFQSRIAKQAQDELVELTQILETMEHQLADAESQFRALSGRANARAKWNAFEAEWKPMQSQISKMIEGWLDIQRQPPLYYSSLYAMTKQAFDLVTRMHSGFASTLSIGPNAALGVESLRDGDLARSMMLALRAKILVLERTPIEPGKLPPQPK